jgi:flagellar biosynthesis/type III secretory pathway protein FliH
VPAAKKPVRAAAKEAVRRTAVPVAKEVVRTAVPVAKEVVRTAVPVAKEVVRTAAKKAIRKMTTVVVTMFCT